MSIDSNHFLVKVLAMPVIFLSWAFTLVFVGSFVGLLIVFAFQGHLGHNLGTPAFLWFGPLLLLTIPIIKRNPYSVHQILGYTTLFFGLVVIATCLLRLIGVV